MGWNGWLSRRLERRERLKRTVLKLERLEERVVLNGQYFKLFEDDFSQDWSNLSLISTSDGWDGVPSIIGYLGDDTGAGTGGATDPWNVTGDSPNIDVIGQSTLANTQGGVHEIEASQTIALQGSATARSPYITIHLDATGRGNLLISYTLKELDSVTVDQKFALQFRLGTGGTWTDVAAGRVSGAFTASGNQTRTLTNIALPTAVSGRNDLEVRIITTDAAGADAMVGIDDIVITSDPIDTTPPTVSSIVRAGTSPTNASSVDYTVTFSESVSGVDLGDFTLTTAGLSGAGIASVSAGPSATYTVTVNTGSGDGTIRLDLIDDDTIADAAGNKLGGTGTGNGNFTTGESYTIDKTAPTVQSISRADADPTNADSVAFTVTFNDTVSGVDPDDFALAVTGLSGAGVASVSAGPSATYTVTVSTGSGSGTLGLNVVDDDTITDSATNPLGGPGAGNGNAIGPVFTIDRTPPAVSRIRRLTPSGPVTNASAVTYEVTFSESVTGVSLSDFALTGGATSAAIGTLGGGGTTYQVSVTAGAVDGTLGLNLVDDDSIHDDAGNALAGSFTGEVYTIDRVAPTVVSITRVSASPSNLAEVQFLVTFSEPVVNATVSGFAVDSAGLGGTPAVTDVSGSGSTRTVTVSTGTGGDGVSSYVELQIAGTAVIADPAGNPLAASTYTPERITIDRTAPTVTSIVRAGTSPTNASSVDFTVTFSEAVVNVDPADFALTADDLSGASVSTVGGGGATWAVSVNTGTGDRYLSIYKAASASIQDLATNALTAAFPPAEYYQIDKTAPTVSRITRIFDPLTNAASVAFLVEFSESVQDLDELDFTLNGTGITGARVTSLTGFDSVWTVTVDTGSGDGDLRLDVLASATITDPAGNDLSAAFTAGEAYTIDKQGPTLFAIYTPTVGPVGPNTVVTYNVEFFEDVYAASVTADDFVNAGTAAISVGAIAETAPGKFTVAVTPTGPGTLRLRIPAEAVITDTLGNAFVPPAEASATIIVTAQPPVLDSLFDQTTVEGSLLTLTDLATFTDPDGSFAGPFTFTINWGDGTSPDTGTATTDVIGPPVAGSFDGSHTYADDGTYTVTVTVADGDGGSETKTFAVTVTNLQPILTVVDVQHVDQGQPLTLTDLCTILDAGFANPLNPAGEVDEVFTFSIDWGDDTLPEVGTATVNVVGSPGTPTAASFDGSHVYAEPGAYLVVVTVEDDEGGSTEAVFSVIVADAISPVVQSIVRAGPNPTNAGGVDFIVKFSEPMGNLSGSSFVLTRTGTLAGGFLSGMATVDFTTFTVTVNTGTGSGDLRLDLPANPSSTDPTGNPMTESFSTGEVYTIDRVAPTVTSITRVGAQNPMNADSVDFTVTFSEAVTGVDAADFAVDASGLSGASVGAVSGSGTTWTVSVDTGSGQGTLSIDVSATASISDALGNALTGTFTAGQAYDIDRIVPTVVSIIPLGTSPTNAAIVQFTVTFSESVTGVSPEDFGLFGSSLGASITSIVGGGAIYTLTVTAGSDGVIGLAVAPPDGTIRDQVGNALATGAVSSGTFTLDRTAPTVTSITHASASPTNAASVVFTVTFSEAVTGVGTTDFVVAAPGLTGAGVTGVNPISASVYEVTVSAGTGEGTLRLDAVADGSVTDAVDNVFAAGFTAGQPVDIDTVGPAVTSITRLDTNPTAAATVTFQVTFREPVNGVDPSDFDLSTTGEVNAASVTSVGGSGDTYTVSVNTGTGNGSLHLDVVNDGSITDTLGNALTAPFASGDTYEVVKPPTDPAVVSLVPNGAIRLRRGQDLTLTATVAEVGSSGARAVTFLQNGTPVGTIGVVGNIAQIVITGLRVGNYAFTARYDGDDQHLPGTSSAVLVEVGTPNTLFVVKAYDDLTGRDVSPRAAALIAALDAGTMNRTEVVMAILHTPEYYSRAVRDAYERLLRRPPTTKELNDRVGLLAAGQTVPQLEAWLMGTPEYFTRCGRTPGGFRAAVIHDLTAGVFAAATRRALASGLRAVAPAGGVATQAARTSFVIALMGSTFGRTATVQSLFGRFLGRPADARLRTFANLLRFERGYDQVEAALLASATYAP